MRSYAPMLDDDLKRLTEQLAGRPAIFIREPYLAPGTIMWDVEQLPRVLAAPDVFDSLQKRIQQGKQG